MVKKTDVLVELVDTLICSQCSFAIYRMSGDETIWIVISDNANASRIISSEMLLATPGFVLAPFAFPSHNGWLIPADHVFTQPEAALAFAKTLADLPKHYQPTGLSADVPDPRSCYTETFTRFHKALNKGMFQKLVLSRSQKFTISEHLSVGMILQRALSCYPNATVTLTLTEQTGLWLGATPEILLRHTNRTCTTMALAGTMPVDSQEPWSAKNQLEQALVAQAIRNCVQRYTDNITQRGPYTYEAGPVKHIRTDFSFLLDNPKRLGELVCNLHPTPAVCGLPMPQASAFIREHESRDRELYAGFLGPVRLGGLSSFYVNLRCMTLFPTERVAVIHAGGGLLPSSDQATEWDETCCKMSTLSNLIA